MESPLETKEATSEASKSLDKPSLILLNPFSPEKTSKKVSPPLTQLLVTDPRPQNGVSFPTPPTPPMNAFTKTPSLTTILNSFGEPNPSTKTTKEAPESFPLEFILKNLLEKPESSSTELMIRTS